MRYHFAVTAIQFLVSSTNVSSFQVQPIKYHQQSSTVVASSQLPSKCCIHRSTSHPLKLSSDVAPNDEGNETIVSNQPSDSTSSSGEEKDLNEGEEMAELTPDELTLISTIAQTEKSLLDQFLMTNLSNMPPNVILQLRSAAEGTLSESTSKKYTDEQCTHLEIVGKALVEIMDTNLQSGRDLLKTFLACGEIRKLDAAIAKAMKENKIDMAFFTVLNMNIRDAAMEQIEKGDTELSTTEEGQFSTGDNANFYQILQHIYTRCQEEVEKAVSPGVGLLNKLLRTEQDSIRANQLRHYLCPQKPKTISSPDGKEVQLPGSNALVKPNELIDALQNAVRQIRTVEKSGAVDPVAAADLVENCRQVAIEARLAVGEGYGVESEELKEFELSLQPVFRPDSAESEYIKGV